jgi:MOSC domain-containing protein YiiM
MEPVGEALLVEGSGLEGNADRGGRRQVTLLDAEAWERATRSIGVDVPPIARRANLLVRGIDLEASRERVVRVGEARIEIGGETLPCGQMEANAPGLRTALEPEWRGGAYGVVLAGGLISVGDEVGWA